LTFLLVGRQTKWQVLNPEAGLARSTSVTLTEAELRIMNALWDRGPSTVHEVLNALPAKPVLAYNSVLTIVRILEKKGYVKHVKDGRSHIYAAQIDRQHASRFEVKHLVGRFFGDSHEMLVLNILEEKGVDEEELQRLRRLLEGSR
jgi:predicted transcriptional regulator